MQVFDFISMAFGSRGILPCWESACHMAVQEVWETHRWRSALDGRVTSVARFTRMTAGDSTPGSL